MKKLYTLVCICFAFTGWVTAQPYGNEWINFATNQPHSVQQYFKVSVWRDGIYRISVADLQSAQFPGSFNPKHLQLFHNGIEQYIHVEGEADGVMDPNDYIEFYGIRNDGSVDTKLYKNPNNQVNKNLSLYTDTAAYFLTINSNPLIVNKRMVIETDVNYIGYNPLPYVVTESFEDYKIIFHASSISEVIDSEFDDGEGWYSGHVLGPISFSLSVPNVSNDPSAPIAQASTVAMGGNYNGGNQHILYLDVNGAKDTSYFVGFEVSRFNLPLVSNSSISSGTATFAFDVGPGVANRNHFSYVKMVYPHTMSFGGQSSNFFKLQVPGNLSPNKSLLNFSNLNLSSPKLYMFSGDTLKKVTVTGSGTNWQVLVPTYNADKNCFITDSIYTSATGHLRIAPVSNDLTNFAKFTNFLYVSQADYIIISHQQLWNKAESYKTYRANTGFTPLLVDIDELYNQFAFGVQQHPLSVRNFCEFALDTFTVKPEYLLLIGKSVSMADTRYNAGNWSKNLVPTFGFPASDLLLASLFTDTLPRADIAVGRISASNDNDVQAYLDKITVHEQQLQDCPQEWMKNVLHFGGGSNLGEQNDIKNILLELEAIVEDTVLGGHVETFLKTSSDPIQVNLSQYLQALIDSGVTLMTFVAHASGTTFDISTDLPQNYHNQDRYPLMLANSCFVGDIHDPLRRIVEDFVLLPDKGAIGFIAQPSVGYLGYLRFYSSHLYKELSLYNYGGRIGKIMKATIDTIYGLPDANSSTYNNYMFRSVCSGMTLSGDPALIMNSFDKPDYEISTASVFFTPTMVTSDLDSFEVNVVIKNLGMVVTTPIVVHLSRHFPDGGASFEMDTTIAYVAYKDTLTIRLPLENVRGLGVNMFSVYVDYSSNVNECNEANNKADSVPLQIQSSDIVPVYPAEFSIVPVNTIQLKASTINPFTPTKPYVFQIDTVDTFNSPFMQQGLVNSSGGVVKWPPTPTLTLTPDLVYYWRVSRDSMPGDTIHPNWKESSFIHKPNLTGWSQAHYSQYKKDSYTNINYSNTVDSTFQFVTSFSSLTVRNYMHPVSPHQVPTIEINQVVREYEMCGTPPSIHVFVIDPISLELWNTGQYNFGQYNVFNTSTGVGQCRQRAERYFIFRDTPSQRVAMLNMLSNSIPDGYYVGIYSVFSPQYSTWDPALIDTLNTWGSDSIGFIQNGQPWIFFTKKHDINFTPQEEIGDSIEQYIQLSASLGGNWDKGFVNSVEIGPAASWTSFHWEQFPLETGVSADSASVDILGIQPNGVEVPLAGFQGIQVGTPDLNINSIDASVYPKLRLRSYLEDETLHSPPQLKRWQIYYDEVPELALNPSRYFSLNNDTLDEGGDISMQMAIENIGNVNADSVLVDFYLYDKNRVRHNISSPRYDSLSPGDTLIASVNFNTGGYDGFNSLWIEANPHNDQPEQYHLNNLAEILFRVNRDITNPILDVTFDGVHIMNGDIISGRPEILVKLKDENQHLALDDTSDWQVYIKDPDGIQNKLYFEPGSCSGPANEFLKWCPGGLPQNTFRIEYKPVFLKDGIYELWVQATDVSGNISGDNNYRITFEVINKATITEVINYPNPFSTSTRFVFTLTGSQVPEDFKIQIMTVTGKVIREIQRDELGPIHIGRNVTDFAWNGKDEFGDQLANGVYLYRVLTRLNGSNIEKRETEADKFFTKGWGKMYLMR